MSHSIKPTEEVGQVIRIAPKRIAPSGDHPVSVDALESEYRQMQGLSSHYVHQIEAPAP